MAGDTEDLVISVSADTKQITNAINRLLGVVNTSTSGIEKAFSRSGTAMDKAGLSATRLQKQIGALTGITAFKDRGADIEAYGAQLDAVRAKYVPLFAAQQQYIKSLSDINKAAKVGAISEKERVSAIASTKSAFAQQVVGMRASSGATEEIAKTGKLASYELINLSRQIQDVFVSLVSGQSVGTVFVQQGTQIADVYGSSKTGTVGGSLKQVGGIIASVITPMRLLGLGVAAGGALALASLASWKSYTLQLDDTAKSAGASTQELAKLQAAASIKGISFDSFNKGIEQFGKDVYDAKNNMGGLAEVLRVNGMHASNFEDALGNVAELIKNAKDDQQALSILQQAGLPATMQWVRLLSNGRDGLKAAKDAAVLFGDSADKEMIDKARQFDEAWNKVQGNFSQGWRNAAVNAGGYIKTVLDLIPKATPLQLSLPPGLKNAFLADSLKNGRGTTLTANSDVSSSYSFMQPAKKKPTEDPRDVKNRIALAQQYLGLLGQTTTASEARRQVELQLAAAATAGVYVDEKRAETLKKLAEENILGITAIKQQTDAQKIEAATVGMSAGQAAAYTAAQNALNDAKRNGRALTAANIADINKEAAALGAATQAATNKKIAEDISFNRKTAFFTDEDVQIAQTLAGKFGNDIPAALASSDAAAIRFNNTLKTIGDLGQLVTRGVFTDFSQQIRNGATAMEALRTAGVNALGKISDKLMEMAADNLWKSAFGGTTGGLGGFFSSIFGGAGSGAGSVGVVGAAGGMVVPTYLASGGLVSGPGSGTSDSIPARLSNGEFVVNASATAKNRNLLEALNAPGFAAGGFVGTPSLPSIPTTTANDNSSVSVSMPISIDARGADNEGLAIVSNQLAQLKSELPSRVVSAVLDAKKRRVLA